MGIKSNMRVTTPTGVIEAMSGDNTSIPSGYAICNGQDLLKSAYPQLFAIVGTTFGTPANPLFFRIPDLRGQFIRGLDLGRGVDLSRTLGTDQVDTFTAHNHTYQKYGAVNLTTDGGSHFYGTTAINTLAAGGNETRPRNSTTIYVVKL